eukprot:scaffold372632_cov18-Prasinocladus_malaysianus.AAC.1
MHLINEAAIALHKKLTASKVLWRLLYVRMSMAGKPGHYSRKAFQERVFLPPEIVVESAETAPVGPAVLAGS